MTQKKRDFDEGRTFQERFIEQYRKKYSTHEQMAKAFGVSRPTISGWFNGTSTPSIHVLKKIAQHFNVSADYLLGLSDAASPDPTLRSAVEYTGLSEAAIIRLHFGIDEFGCGLFEENKDEHLTAASSLILSDAFELMINSLLEIPKVSYRRKMYEILLMQLLENRSSQSEGTTASAAAVRKVLGTIQNEGSSLEESICVKIETMDEAALLDHIRSRYSTNKQASELNQFHAAKAFTSYIDQLVEENYKKAEQLFISK